MTYSYVKGVLAIFMDGCIGTSDFHISFRNIFKHMLYYYLVFIGWNQVLL